mmetsp:Transcript_4390/g.12825  ORF Transcript_4390/g.12825 Transcript_4390/m.12825 type:complete len:338 (+) Transcript_4390:1523-2536(+)
MRRMKPSGTGSSVPPCTGCSVRCASSRSTPGAASSSATKGAAEAPTPCSPPGAGGHSASQDVPAKSARTRSTSAVPRLCTALPRARRERRGRPDSRPGRPATARNAGNTSASSHSSNSSSRRRPQASASSGREPQKRSPPAQVSKSSARPSGCRCWAASAKSTSSRSSSRRSPSSPGAACRAGSSTSESCSSRCALSRPLARSWGQSSSSLARPWARRAPRPAGERRLRAQSSTTSSSGVKAARRCRAKAAQSRAKVALLTSSGASPRVTAMLKHCPGFTEPGSCRNAESQCPNNARANLLRSSRGNGTRKAVAKIGGTCAGPRSSNAPRVRRTSAR